MRSFGSKIKLPEERSELSPETSHESTLLGALHTLFVGSGARACVTSVGGEEGDINFCRNSAFAPRFNGCSFVVRSLNAGGRARAFLIYVCALREEGKSTNDALCDA